MGRATRTAIITATKSTRQHKKVETDKEDAVDTKEPEIVNDDESSIDESESKQSDGDEEIMQDQEMNEVEDGVIDDESDDEAPEGISLKEGKERAQENIKNLLEAQKAVKDHKKQLKQYHEQKNRATNKKRKVLIPEKMTKAVLTLAAETAGDDKVDAVLVPSTGKHAKENARRKLKKKERNRKNTQMFFDEDDEGFEDVEEHSKEPVIGAKHLASVSKSKDIGSDARKFLNEHFFGRRLSREGKDRQRFYVKHQIGVRKKM